MSTAASKIVWNSWMGMIQTVLVFKAGLNVSRDWVSTC